jgi:hypothetical protein
MHIANIPRRYGKLHTEVRVDSKLLKERDKMTHGCFGLSNATWHGRSQAVLSLRWLTPQKSDGYQDFYNNALPCNLRFKSTVFLSTGYVGKGPYDVAQTVEDVTALSRVYPNL